MDATEPVTWVLVTRADGDPDYAVNVCHYCAIVHTDEDMVTERCEADNDLGPGEDLVCDICKRVIASAP